MTTPTENWPKPWMLARHADAVKHGFIWIEPIDESDAKSLRDRMYRIRRRHDKSMAAFIPPEFHLVMIGRWEPGPDGTGRLPLIYNKRPDGKPLPGVRVPDESEVAEHFAPPEIEPMIVDPHALEIKPEEIGSLVERLRKSAKDRTND